MNDPRIDLLSKNVPIRPCMQVWKLVKKMIPIINKYTSKMLGNAKNVKVWEYKIMGKEPLNLLTDHEE